MNQLNETCNRKTDDFWSSVLILSVLSILENTLLSSAKHNNVMILHHTEHRHVYNITVVSHFTDTNLFTRFSIHRLSHSSYNVLFSSHRYQIPTVSSTITDYKLVSFIQWITFLYTSYITSKKYHSRRNTMFNEQGRQ